MKNISQELLAKYKKQLRLLDWDIELIEYPTLGVEAQTKLIYHDYKAVIQIRSELSDVDKEKTLIHELLHLIFRDAYDIFTEQCENEFAKEYCTKQHERAIEKTAKIIYGLNHDKE
jgi:Zn-dependent peptidase ImmA (M78 family)